MIPSKTVIVVFFLGLMIADVEVDTRSEFIYWSEVQLQENGIMRIKADGSGLERVISSGNLGISSMALDWVAGWLVTNFLHFDVIPFVEVNNTGLLNRQSRVHVVQSSAINKIFISLQFLQNHINSFPNLQKS